jgi:AraC-like DNA-binding protein
MNSLSIASADATSDVRTTCRSVAAPCEAAAGASRVSTILVRVLADVVQQRGIEPASLLGTLSSDAKRPLWELDTWLSLREFQALFSRAVLLTAEPALGLLCGSSASEPSFELVAPLVSHARSLRHALELACQFHPLVLDGAALQVSERAGRAQVRCEFPRLEPMLDRGLAEFMVAGLLRMLLAFGGRRANVHEVCFAHARPAYHHAYTAAFKGSERFARPFTGIEFESRLLDRPHLHCQPELQALLHAHAERSLERLSRPKTFVERLQALLRTQARGRRPDMKRAARELGVSVRSLRRRLDEEGSSFRAVAQFSLQEAACSLLRNPELTVQATSHALGFADPTAFHRAFKRWTGLTPAEYREPDHSPINTGRTA